MKAYCYAALVFLSLWTFDTACVCAGLDAFSPTDSTPATSFDIANPTASLGRHELALNLLPKEYRTELILLSESLVRLSSEDTPYCSGRLVTLLQSCTKDTLSAEDRDEAAMLLTLCDRSRDYVPPMECEGISIRNWGTEKHDIKRCAMALDQHQNFQRAFDVYRILVIPEKCKSLNGIFNVDPARAIYHNITLDLVTFLQAFSKREARNDEYFTRWDEHLKAFQEATDDLSISKHSLANFNEQFVVDLSGMMQILNATFEELMAKGLEANSEISLELKDSLRKARKEHEISLKQAISTVEASLSAGTRSILDVAQERQEELGLATSYAINQLMGAVNDLKLARQEFEVLSVFVKETTSKAYNQAFLLDTKQYEMSESIAGLSLEIKALLNTTRELNASMTDIKLRNIGQLSWSWPSGAGLLIKVVNCLALSPYWVLGFLVFSLPRFLCDRLVKSFLWFAVSSFSCMMSLLLGHRRTRSNKYDTEQNQYSPLPLAVSKPLQLDNNASIRFHHKRDALDALAIEALRPASHRIAEVSAAHQTLPSSPSATLNDWTPARARARTISRLPTRLFNSEPLP